VKSEAAEATAAAIAHKATFVGGGTAFWGGITANTVAALGGLLVALVGLSVQWYYKHKEDRRRDELHRRRMNDLLRGYEDDQDV